MALLVSIGTDGVTDWLKTPDGQKFNLGSLSVLQFITKLATSSGQARSALDRFLVDGEAMLSVNEDKMWALLTPHRARWASIGPFMPSDQQSPERSKMGTISENLHRMEKVILFLDKHAAQRSQHKRAFEFLKKEASQVLGPSQADLAYYDLSGHHDANLKLAQTVLARSRDTLASIDAKVAEGRKFNAARARYDVHQLTSKVASLCENASDFAGDATHNTLQKLARRAEEIYSLFNPQKS